MITSDKRGNIDVVSFSNIKFNAETADEVREHVSHFFREPHARVIISLGGIQYIDSTGFGALLSILRYAKDNYGILKICSVEPQVQNLFEALHLNMVFEIHPDIDKCIESFG